MEIEKTNIEGCFILKPRVFKDERGSFFESFNQKTFEKLTGLKINFVQDNQSTSTKGVLRGLHFQKGEYAQAKLVRVTRGSVLDVAVDLRQDSPTLGKHFAIELNDQNNYQLFVPSGFAHGFIVLSDEAVFNYKCDNYYHKEAESGIRYDDFDLEIDWKLKSSEILLSEKDNILSNFSELNK
ncbi:dTDP-4-dehydrorhamnose 3,5-epimerase [Aquimarina sp. BL5]|uniref:dTDP-4-dehydrorhamnose 3,5-epimerase n=1 Tax=Aquimarina sp. BL5 TaxID=1714860 RepID=UPI000E4C830A|nr:dTDP-4-dehydrorhamnose 3,5-epimerase [Aquimarina sp. BL5]AXT54072.1 dTDP-4-dehydrorhamnose 3,5-epimerase [Aquimarina sp. BL5]RKN03261.1 dTDP-4-dehydrorhamnose 3,5-epimerase [Aquimarina sp. BL5]